MSGFHSQRGSNFGVQTNTESFVKLNGTPLLTVSLLSFAHQPPLGEDLKELLTRCKREEVDDLFFASKVPMDLFLLM